MARFNTSNKSSGKTENLAGGEAYQQSPKMELISILLTSFVKNQFYKSADETMDRVSELVKTIDPMFAAKASIYARNEFGMRSITHVVAGELAKTQKGLEWLKRYYDKVVRRPDDMLEIMSYYISKYGKRPIPNSLKKGLAKAFDKFDGYQLAKYRGENRDFKLRDLVNLVHPRSTDKNSEAMKQLVEGTLTITGKTWEAKLSKAGQVAETEEQKDKLKEEAWAELLKEKKLGYFALIRNARNIVDQAPELVDVAVEQITDREAIKKSLVLPFQLLKAVQELQKLPSTKSSKMLSALTEAVEISLDNTPSFPGNTLIALDVSGSMNGQPLEIGALFAAALFKTNNADLQVFSDDAHFVGFNKRDSLATLQAQINAVARSVSGGTNFNAIFNKLKVKYDRIIILSDMQAWVGYDVPKAAFSTYKKNSGADPNIYSFDLAGHGTLQFPERNIYCIAGFSEKVLDLMKVLEEDRNILINKIEAIEI